MASKTYGSAIRDVRRYLVRAGFLCGRRTGKVGLSEVQKAKLAYFYETCWKIVHFHQVRDFKTYSRTNLTFTTTIAEMLPHSITLRVTGAIKQKNLTKEGDFASFALKWKIKIVVKQGSFLIPAGIFFSLISCYQTCTESLSLHYITQNIIVVVKEGLQIQRRCKGRNIWESCWTWHRVW